MAGLTPGTLKLHQMLIRHARGMLAAWEEWVRGQLPPVKEEDNPDPVQHFKSVANDYQRRAK
jgi:hypothetical protein